MGVLVLVAVGVEILGIGGCWSWRFWLMVVVVAAGP